MYNAFQWLYNTLGSAISAVSNTVTQVANGIVLTINSWFTTLSNGLMDAFMWVVQTIGNNIGSAIGALQGWANTIVTGINYTLSGIEQSIINGLAGIQRWANDAVHGLENTIGVIAGGVADGVKTFVDKLVTGKLAESNTLVLGQFENTNAKIATVTDQIGQLLLGVATALGEGLQALIDWLLKGLTYVATMIVGAIEAVVSAISSALSGIFSGIINAITSAMSPGSPDPQLSTAVNVMIGTSWKRQMEIIKSAYHSDPTPEEIQSTAISVAGALVGAGATGLIAGAAIDLAHPIKEVMASRTIREIMWMVGVPAVTASIITLPTAVGLLTPLRYAMNETFQPMQAGASDIVRFAVRECFDPGRLQDLLAFMPGDEYFAAMRREGFSATWAQYFWGAHWVLPPIDMLNQYLYRHEEFIDVWRKYIRYEDYIPECIPWLEEVIHPPWTRVDIRRMWEMGVIDEETMTREYMWGGYDRAHAELLTLWTKIYIASPDLKARYKNGWISREQVEQELVSMGMPGDRVTSFIQTFIVAGAEERTSKERDLTKADVLGLFKYNEINAAQARELLVGLGYDDTEAAYLVALQADKLTTELKDLTTSQITKAYTLEVFTRDEARTRLIAAGWSEAAAETLLRLEDVKLADNKVVKASERDLSRTDITRAVTMGIIDLDTGKKYLAYLGYSDWEIDVILKLAGLA